MTDNFKFTTGSDTIANDLTVGDDVTAEDVIVTDDVTVGDDATITGDLAVTGNTLLTGTLWVTGATSVSSLTASVGVQSSAVARTATADGTGTGTIAAGTSFVSVTSDNADKIIKLPTPVLWNIIYIKEASTVGFEVRPAAETQFINGTECSSGKELAIANGAGIAVFVCTVAGTAGKWVQYYIDDDGTIDAGGTPD